MSQSRVLLALCFAMMLASKAQCQTGAVGSDADLKGDYAFTFNGMTTGGSGASTPFAAVGRFTADGAGTLSQGEVDTNGIGASEKLIAQSFTGTYQIGADHRGVMTLNIPGGGNLAFVMMADGNARFVEIDASGGKGTVGSGTMERADTTAFNTSQIAGGYAFGLAGFDQSNNRAAIAGHVSSSGSGFFSDGAVDANQAGRFTTLTLFAASYTVSDTATGRGVIIFPALLGGVLQNLDFVFYTVSAGRLFAMETDAVTTVTPLLNGSFIRQQTPQGGFSNASLNGAMVTYLSGRTASGCGTAMAPASNVIVGVLSANGNGGLSLGYDQNCGGAAQSTFGLVGSYSVAGNGRAAIRVGTNYLVAYLLNSNQAFLLASDSSVLFGLGDPQSAGVLDNSSVSGTYSGLAINPVTLGTTIFSGAFFATGAAPTGSITGTYDVGAPSGATLGASANATYTISSTPVNGRGSLNGGIGGNGFLYVISPTKFVVIPTSDANPAIQLFEQ